MLQNIQCAFLSQCFGAVAANVAEALYAGVTVELFAPAA
jgi:hypothetical protein